MMAPPLSATNDWVSSFPAKLIDLTLDHPLDHKGPENVVSDSHPRSADHNSLELRDVDHVSEFS